MSSLLRIVAIVVVLIGACIAALYFIPVDTYRVPIENAATKSTGREVKIAGPMHLTVYPEIGVSLGDVSIANAPGAKEPLMAQAQSIVVGVRLIPLISRKLEVTTLVLDHPVIHLEVAKNGTPNWQLANAAPPGGAGAPASAPKGGTNALAALSISGLKISNGLITYYDAAKETTKTVSDANVTLSMSALNQPLTLNATATYQAQRFTLTAHVDNPSALIGGQTTPATATLSSDLMKASFSGSLAGKGASEGQFSLDVPSLKNVIQWTGKTPPKVNGLGALSAKGMLTANAGRYSLDKGTLSLDGMNLTADLAVDTTHQVPLVTGNVAVDQLDLGRYVASEPAGQPGGGGAPAAKGWSTSPLALGALKTADVNLGLTVGGLTMQKFTLGKTAMKVALKGGRLDANLTNVALYQGSGNGELVADASGATPTFAAKLDVQGVAVKALLSGLINMDRIEGTGAVNLDVTSRGDNQQAIMNALSGKGSMNAKNGAIRGVDLAAVAKTVQNTLTNPLSITNATNERASTDFAELGGTFVITDGKLHTDDFHLLNPFVRISGDGDVNLAKRTIDLHLEPRAVASIKGQGGELSAGGVGIPFRVSGTWDKLKYEPDTGRVVKGLLSGQSPAGSALGGILGGNKSDSTSQKNGEQNSNPVGDALKGLLGGK